jgi:hypothetical protein
MADPDAPTPAGYTCNQGAPKVTGRVRVQEFRTLRRNSLRGFATVQFASGMTIAEIAIHQLGSGVWAAPPGRPIIRDGAVLRADDGKVRYAPIVTFMNHGTRSSWSRQVITAVREVYPETFDPAEDGE